MAGDREFETWPGVGGWAECDVDGATWHIATVAGGHRAGYVTVNDADQWVAGIYDRRGDVRIVGAGYPSLHAAKLAVDRARNT